METKIKEILENTLPKKAFKIIEVYNGFFNDKYLKIGFAASDYIINGVRSQYPQYVSLKLDLKTLELSPQVFGGNGGQHIYRQPDKTHPKEKFLYMQNIKIPFRKPPKEEKSVLNAIERFAQNWVKALRDNKDKLMYQNDVNYDTLLNE